MTNFSSGGWGDGHDDDHSPVLYMHIVKKPVFYASITHCDGSKLIYVYLLIPLTLHRSSATYSTDQIRKLPSIISAEKGTIGQRKKQLIGHAKVNPKKAVLATRRKRDKNKTPQMHTHTHNTH